MKTSLRQPLKWKDLGLGVKLGIGFGILIAVFSTLGFMALINMRAIQQKTSQLGEDLIPMVTATYNMEHFTHEAMHAMLGYSLSEEEHYYVSAKNHIARTERYYQQADSMINASPALARFAESSAKIGANLGAFTEYTEEMAALNNRVKRLRESMEDTYKTFTRYSHALLIKENLDFRKKLLDKSTPEEELVNLHRLSKMVNLIIDKGNISRIEAIQALAQKNPQLIKDVNERHYQYLFSIIEEMRAIADSQSASYLNRLETSVFIYQQSLLELAGYIDEARRLEKKLEESAFTALFEAHFISAESNKITSQSSKETIVLLESSTRFLIFGLLLSLIIAILFSVITTKAITVPINKSVVFAQKVAAGDLNADVNVNQNDEVGVLAEALKGMLLKLRDNIQALKHTERRMLKTVLETEQKERKRFAEDLHDGLGPLLSTIKLYLNSFESKRHDPGQRKLMLQNANEVIDEAITNTKSIANNLMPRLLEDFGMEVALESFFEHIRNTNALSIHFQCESNGRKNDPKIESMLYNTILELTNNTIKHANATTIHVKMKQNDDICEVHYQDNGIGFDMKEALADNLENLGLKNIVSRIQSVNGNIDLWSEQNKGFKATIHI